MESVLYFEIFSYPMTREEISKSLAPTNENSNEFKVALDRLVSEEMLFKVDEYYMARDNPEWVSVRRERNERAEKYLRIANRMGRLIQSFPFVRAVFISGSLSKKWMPPDGDIDFFIITEPKRLWIARTFLILFKKIFLFNSHKYFCVNYFVDLNHLEIEEKNRFTATEILTLMPITGKHLYNEFCLANNWVTEFYPSFPSLNGHHAEPKQPGFPKRALESIFRNSLGEKLDNFFMKKTVRHWTKKFDHFDENEFNVALKSRKYVSKHHPNHFQQKVLSKHKEKLEEFTKQYETRVNSNSQSS